MNDSITVTYSDTITVLIPSVHPVTSVIVRVYVPTVSTSNWSVAIAPGVAGKILLCTTDSGPVHVKV